LGVAHNPCSGCSLASEGSGQAIQVQTNQFQSMSGYKHDPIANTGLGFTAWFQIRILVFGSWSFLLIKKTSLPVPVNSYASFKIIAEYSLKNCFSY
jgi:hypothetical protein